MLSSRCRLWCGSNLSEGIARDGSPALRNVAEGPTTDKMPTFDIYLPVRLAQHNKAIFGTLFVLSETMATTFWLRSR
jgi:hypothetical protein